MRSQGVIRFEMPEDTLPLAAELSIMDRAMIRAGVPSAKVKQLKKDSEAFGKQRDANERLHNDDVR